MSTLRCLTVFLILLPLGGTNAFGQKRENIKTVVTMGEIKSLYALHKIVELRTQDRGTTKFSVTTNTEFSSDSMKGLADLKPGKTIAITHTLGQTGEPKEAIAILPTGEIPPPPRRLPVAPQPTPTPS